MTVWQNTLSYIWLSDWRSLVLQRGQQLIIFDINHKYVVQTASQNAHKLFSYISEVRHHSGTTKSNNKSINVHVRWINVKTTHLSHVTVRLRRRTGSLTPEKNAFQRENVCNVNLTLEIDAFMCDLHVNLNFHMWKESLMTCEFHIFTCDHTATILTFKTRLMSDVNRAFLFYIRTPYCVFCHMWMTTVCKRCVWKKFNNFLGVSEYFMTSVSWTRSAVDVYTKHPDARE